MAALRRRRLFLVAGMAALFVSYTGIWLRMINDPAARTGSDFIIFYTAGRVAQTYGPSQVYNLDLQHDVEQEQVGFPLAPEQVLPYNHLPFLIPLLQVVIREGYVQSFYRWVLVLIGIYIAGLSLFGLLLKRAGMEKEDVRMAKLAGLLFLPIFVSLMNGQDTAILVLGAAMWVYGLMTEKPVLSGLGLSLTTVRPHIALLLALPMFFHNRKLFFTFVLGSGILGIASITNLGREGLQDFINILRITAGGNWYGVKPEEMFNLIGALTRLLPSVEPVVIRWIGWTVFGIAAIGLCSLWRRKTDSLPERIGLTTTMALFAAPHLYFHDLSLLLVPMYGLIWLSPGNEGLRDALVVLPVGLSLLLLVSNLSPYFQFAVPYIIMLALAGYPYYFKSRLMVTRSHRS